MPTYTIDNPATGETLYITNRRTPELTRLISSLFIIRTSPRLTITDDTGQTQTLTGDELLRWAEEEE